MIVSNAPVIEIHAVSKHFGDRMAVDNLDLEVPARTCFGLLGPNGAGKTTTLRMIYGVTRPSSGTILVFGMDISRNSRAVRARLGVTLQQNVLIEALSPKENLRVFGRYHLLHEPELSRRAEELIDFLELRSHAEVPVKRLSGGFQRRLAIALSLINGPELLILDEPTRGVDVGAKAEIHALIGDLAAQGAAILLISSELPELLSLSHRILVLRAGRAVGEVSREVATQDALLRMMAGLDESRQAADAVVGERIARGAG